MLKILEKHRLVVLGGIVALALFLRLDGLGAAGFSEDEAHKIEASRAYLQGGFFVNLEHPMLMKGLITLSLVGTKAWNEHISPAHPVSEETAVRLPNVVFGSLMAIVIFIVANELFSFGVGLISAAFWATGVAAIMFNRVAKEDTMLVFFTWLGYYFYLKAKNLGAAKSKRQQGFFALSGLSFGLMLASKYFPHYFGLNALYYHLFGRNETNQPLRRRDWIMVFGAMGSIFLIVNPLVVFPSVLKYLVAYVGEEMMTHHGYFMMGHVYSNGFWYTPGSVPIYYYVLFLLVKTPLPVMAAFIVGLVVVFKERRHPGHFFLALMFLFWIIPFSLVGGKFLRYTLSLMPTVYVISAVGAVRLYEMIAHKVKRRGKIAYQPALTLASISLLLVAPLWSAYHSGPFYSLYLNPLGQGRVAYFFPHDEIYDAGLRETIKEICETAPRGASVGGESPSVFNYYFAKFGRTDLHYFNLSDPVDQIKGIDDAWVVVQDGRRYFENISLISAIENAGEPSRIVRIAGATAAMIYSPHYVARNSSIERAEFPIHLETVGKVGPPVAHANITARVEVWKPTRQPRSVMAGATLRVQANEHHRYRVIMRQK